jgi:hypothetical protein
MALFVTYLLLERLFGTLKSKISRNGCKKMDKNAKKFEKVSGPGLYKSNLLVQEWPNVQQVSYLTSC